MDINKLHIPTTKLILPGMEAEKLSDKQIAEQLVRMYDEVAINREIFSRSLYEFARYFWPLVQPNPFKESWAIGAICDHLQAMTRKEIKRLIINIPPRHGKSTLISVIWPMWDWFLDPTKSFFCCSYSMNLALRDATLMRNGIQSPQFQALRKIEFKSSVNAKHKFQNLDNGYRFTTSVQGQGVGEGATRLIFDDPNGQECITSERERMNVLDWWRDVMGPRDNDPMAICRLVVQQRLHEMDLTGYLLANERELWDHLKLPIQYNPAIISIPTSLGWVDPRKVEGELLWPQHYDEFYVDMVRKTMPDSHSGQLDQEPVVMTGNIFDSAYWKYYTELPLEQVVRWTVWGDLTFKGEKTNDFCCLSVVATVQKPNLPEEYYVVHVVADQMDFPQQMEEIMLLKLKFPWIQEWRLEDAANAPAVKAQLSEKFPQLQLENLGGKPFVFSAFSNIVKAGLVHLPEEGSVIKLPGNRDHLVAWDIRNKQLSGVPAFVSEAAKVPRGSHDDMIDSVGSNIVYCTMFPVVKPMRAGVVAPPEAKYGDSIRRFWDRGFREDGIRRGW